MMYDFVDDNVSEKLDLGKHAAANSLFSKSISDSDFRLFIFKQPLNVLTFTNAADVSHFRVSDILSVTMK